jgi:cell division protein FtsL
MKAQLDSGPAAHGGDSAGRQRTVATGGDTTGPRRAAAGRPKLTSRAAVLAVVVCAIALSLAYPVREYIAQHRQIAQLQAQHQMEQAQVRSLQAEQRRLTDPSYIEQQARARLNMCMPNETCYVIINGRHGSVLPNPPAARRSPWYVTLWKSVQRADHGQAR